MKKSLSIAYSVVASLLLLWLMDVYLFTETDQPAETKQDNKVEVELPSPEDALPAMDLPQALTLAAVALPEVPISAFNPKAVSAEQQALVDKQASANQQDSADLLATNEAAPSINDQSDSKGGGEEYVKNDTQLALAIEKEIERVEYSEATFEKQIQSTFSQLTGLDSQSLTFNLPQNRQQRGRFIDHMYRCESMQFGALITGRDGQQSLMTLIKSKHGTSSELMRMVHGGLSSQEQKRLRAYAPSGQPVRLFPKAIDMQLSRHIAAHLSQQPLHQFSASYELRTNGIFLNDIMLNQSAVDGSWQLTGFMC